MAKTAIIQTDFSAGELTPRMKGRVDTSRYQKGAETIENCVVAVHGGVDRRGGLRWLASAKLGDARKVRLIRYVFNVAQAYLVEFGHLYVRFYTATGAVILDGSMVPLELASPYTEDQLFSIRYKQGGDTMLLFHQDVPTQRLRRLNSTAWALGPVPWITEPFGEIGAVPVSRLALSAATVGTGRTFTTAATDVPSAPTIGVASPLRAAASVAFTPGDGGGVAVDYFIATSSPGGKTGTAPRSPILVEGLTNGVAYTFTVQAHNSRGLSAASAASNSVTPTASSPAPYITASIAPSPFSRDTVNGSNKAIIGPTAAGADGTAPYTYRWEKIGGGSGITIDIPNQAQVGIRSSGFGTVNVATLRVHVTDANGATGSADVLVSVRHTNTSGGGGPLEP